MKKKVKILTCCAKQFFDHNCLNLAASISFYAIFSLLPLVFLVFYLIGFFLGAKPWLFLKIMEFIKQSLPYLNDSIVKDIKGVIENRKVFGWISVVSLLWSAEFVILAIRDAMDQIFGNIRKKSFLETRLAVWGVFLIWSFVILLSISLTVAAEIISKIAISNVGMDISSYLVKSLTFIKYFLPLLLMFFAVASVLKIMAGNRITIKYAFLGSAIFSVLWEAAKHTFSIYITHFGTFYGSFGALMILLLWIYYSAIIFLFSTEFIACLTARGKR